MTSGGIVFDAWNMLDVTNDAPEATKLPRLGSARSR